MKKTVWIEDSKRKTGHGRVRWYNPVTGKKAPGIRFTTTAEGKRIEAEKVLWLGDWKAGDAASQKSPLELLAEHLHWCATREEPCRPASIRTRRVHVEKFLERPSIKSAADFTLDEIQKWIAEMRTRGVGQGGLHAYLKECKAFLKWCEMSKYIPACPKFKVPKCPRGGKRLGLDVLQSFIDASTGWFKSFLILRANTGCRLSDLLRLDWEDIDFSNWVWTISPNKEKTKKQRLIPLGKPEQNALLSILGGRDPKKMVGPVFMITTRQNPIPRRLDGDTVTRHWNQTKKAAGYEGRAKGHDIRHTFASEFQGRLESLLELCGWSSMEMAIRYKHAKTKEVREDKERFGVNLG